VLKPEFRQGLKEQFDVRYSFIDAKECAYDLVIKVFALRIKLFLTINVSRSG